MLKPSQLLSVLLVGITFAAVSAVVSCMAPPLDSDTVSEKVRFFARHGDRYDLLFFGSSLTVRGIKPLEFDAELRRQGIALRSFNFAAMGMLAHEANQLIRTTLANKPKRLRWVLIELGGYVPRIEEANLFSQRVIAWHDFTETASVLETIRLMDASLPWRIRQSWLHMLHMSARYFPVGRGRDIVRNRMDAGDRAALYEREAQWFMISGGYRPYPPELLASPSPHRGRREFVAAPEKYEEAVRHFTENSLVEISLDSSNIAALSEQVATIRAAGAEPIYFVPPITVPSPYSHAVLAAGLVPTVLALNDPERYPELYDLAVRFDKEHLNARGADLYSAALAGRVAEWIRTRPQFKRLKRLKPLIPQRR